MEYQIPMPPAQTTTSIDSFLEEQTVATNEAKPTDLPPGEIETFAEIPKYVPPEAEAKPMFDEQPPEEQQSGPGTTEAPKAEKKASKEYEDKVISSIVDSADNLISMLPSMYSGHPDKLRYRASQQEKSDLIVALEPFKDWIIDKCPAILPFLLILGLYLFSKISLAQRDKELIEENERLKKENNTLKKMDTAAKNPKERKSWKLGNDGYYQNTPSGVYIKRATATPSDLESPSFKDIESILEANDLALVLKAFNMTEADLLAKGVKIKK